MDTAFVHPGSKLYVPTHVGVNRDEGLSSFRRGWYSPRMWGCPVLYLENPLLAGADWLSGIGTNRGQGGEVRCRSVKQRTTTK